jgi:hypothetical protein
LREKERRDEGAESAERARAFSDLFLSHSKARIKERKKDR